MNNLSDAVERHYWKAATFLVILILVGSGFWGLRRFAPAVFLGEPDFVAGPNATRPQSTPLQDEPALLNINTATASELGTLPGIGPSMAQRIIHYRLENGPFTSVDALQNVKGIGAKTLAKLKPFIAAKQLDPDPTVLRENVLYRQIPGLRERICDELYLVCQPDRCSVRTFCQKSIIEPLAVSKPIPITIKSDSGNHDELELIGRKKCAGRARF